MRAPYLKRIWLDQDRVPNKDIYPFCLPIFSRDEFSLEFDCPVTIIVGENGVGKSTILEGIAGLAGYDEAGGGKGYMPVDHSRAVEAMGRDLSKSLRASWLPKVTQGWFFRAESFFSVSRYLDQAAMDAAAAPPDFLSHSHGEGFPMARASFAFSRSAAETKACTSSMSPNRLCPHRGRCNSSSCYAVWIIRVSAKSSWQRTRPS
jgi:predicted ATPase